MQASEALGHLMQRVNVETHVPALWHGRLDKTHDQVQEARALAKA